MTAKPEEHLEVDVDVADVDVRRDQLERGRGSHRVPRRAADDEQHQRDDRSELNAGNEVPLIEPTKPAYERAEDAGEERRDAEHDDAGEVDASCPGCRARAANRTTRAGAGRGDPRERDDDDRGEHRDGEHDVVVAPVGLADARPRCAWTPADVGPNMMSCV